MKEKKEKKTEKVETEKTVETTILKKSKINIILSILILIIGVLIILELTTKIVSKNLNTFKHFFFRTVGIESKEGNTIGNINNYGYLAEDNNYFYYMCPTENGQYIGISKVSKKDLTGPQTMLIQGTWEIASINSYGDYIYFVTFSQNEVDENDKDADEIDNKIHRVRKNGDQKDEVINDNEFHNDSYKIAVVDGKVYYIGADECIWYMDLNGHHKTRLNENASGFEAINDKYILYNMPEFKDGEETSTSYIMNRNGKNARKINGDRIFTPIIYKNEIYYLTQDRYLHKMDLNGKNDLMLSDAKIYNLNVSDDGIFYLSYTLDEEGNPQAMHINRMDLDGKNNKRLTTLKEYTTSICLGKEKVFFLDSDSDSGYMELMSSDGKQKIDLFKLNYSDYYYMDELIEENNEETENTDETGTETEAQVDPNQQGTEPTDAQNTGEQTE